MRNFQGIVFYEPQNRVKLSNSISVSLKEYSTWVNCPFPLRFTFLLFYQGLNATAKLGQSANSFVVTNRKGITKILPYNPQSAKLKL